MGLPLLVSWGPARHQEMSWAGWISVETTRSAQLALVTFHTLEPPLDSMALFPEMWVTSMGKQGI